MAGNCKNLTEEQKRAMADSIARFFYDFWQNPANQNLKLNLDHNDKRKDKAPASK
jgi:hypothetical protein